MLDLRERSGRRSVGSDYGRGERRLLLSAATIAASGFCLRSASSSAAAASDIPAWLWAIASNRWEPCAAPRSWSLSARERVSATRNRASGAALREGDTSYRWPAFPPTAVISCSGCAVPRKDAGLVRRVPRQPDDDSTARRRSTTACMRVATCSRSATGRCSRTVRRESAPDYRRPGTSGRERRRNQHPNWPRSARLNFLTGWLVAQETDRPARGMRVTSSASCSEERRGKGAARRARRTDRAVGGLAMVAVPSRGVRLERLPDGEHRLRDRRQQVERSCRRERRKPGVYLPAGAPRGITS